MIFSIFLVNRINSSLESHTHKYRTLTAKLSSMNSRFDKLVNSEGGINSDEKFEQYQQLVSEFKDVLTLYVPEMLKKEPFFNEVFYADTKPANIFDWLNDLLTAA